MIPVFSFLVQKGRCRHCAGKISFQYPVVEILMGLVFSLILFKFLPVLYFSIGAYILYVSLFTVIFSLLIVITFYDIRHKVIPNKLVWIFIGISFLSIFINPATSFYFSGKILTLPTFYSLISGPIFALPFVLIWALSKGRLMGLGDSKLILGMGWLLGISQSIFAIVLAFWVGAIIGLLIIIFSKKKFGMKSQIAFAPFLILSIFITFLLNLNFMSLIKIFSFH